MVLDRGLILSKLVEFYLGDGNWVEEVTIGGVWVCRLLGE